VDLLPRGGSHLWHDDHDVDQGGVSIATVAFCTLSIVVAVDYDYHRPAHPLVPANVVRVFDYLWFVGQLLMVSGLPDAPAIDVTFAVEELHPMPASVPLHAPQRPLVDRITCPVLAALYTNGDLLPDSQGIVTEAQVSRGLRITGCRSQTILDGFNQRVAMCRNGLNIFRMDDSFLEHTTSTGIRDPSCGPTPNLVRFNQFARYCDSNGRMYAYELQRAVTSFVGATPGDLAGDVRVADPSVAAVSILPPFALLLEVFGRTDQAGGRPYLTRDDLRTLLLEGRYPTGWAPHRYTTLDVLATLRHV